MSRARCTHCRSPIPEGAETGPFCCHGCAAVHALLVEQGLDRYYELAGDRPAPAPPAAPPASRAWLEPLAAEARERAGEAGSCRLRLDIQGIHCSACVWLLEETFRRRRAGGAIEVNPALGQVELAYDPERFDPERWVAEVEAFGYRFGPARKRSSARAQELPLRLGLAAALSLNVMIFSVSFYFGLTPADSELFPLFSWLSLLLSTGVVAIGGGPFFRAAWAGLRRGVAHLDLPIAAGILLVYAVSLARFAAGRADLGYFDTLVLFVTLMLAGRYLQERLIERNRRYLLEDDGAEGLVTRRIAGERLETVALARIAAGDRLLVAPGELVPVDAELLDGDATFSTDWITGESDAVAAGSGDRVAAGSFNAGPAAIRVRAATAFSASPLVALLRRPAPRAARGGAHLRLWDRVGRGWVAGVGLAALAGLALWLPRDPERALAVAASILVVTCPCAIGIAIPLARELTLHRLRRAGAFVRDPELLDRLPRIGRLLFDKTGTLTLGRLELADPGALARLGATERETLFNLAARSAHPVARAVAETLDGGEARYRPDLSARELPGRGVEAEVEGALWRLGRAAWAAPASGEPEGATVLSRDGAVLVRCATRERLRPDARRELAALAAAGYEIRLVSGDRAERAAAVAAELGLEATRVHSGLTPEGKRDLVAALDRDDTLFLGDGVNDALAFAAATAAGTPAIDRPVVPGRSDFFLLGEGLAPLAALLAAGRRLRFLTRRLLGFAVAYNLAVVAAALAGLVTPLVAAIVMPASTLTLVTLVVTALAPRRGEEGESAVAPRLAEARP